MGRAFREYNVALATNIVAFTLFEHLQAQHRSLDLYRLLRTAGDGAGVEMAGFAEAVRRVAKAARELSDRGGIRVADEVAHGDPTRIIAVALRHFHTYHRGGVISRRGDRIFADDMNLIYYYRNRLVGYGFEACIAPTREAA